MIPAVLVYGGLYTLFRKGLPWVAARHPRARNFAALVVEVFAALGAANALSLIVAMWYPNHLDAPALGAVVAGIFAVAAHQLASDMASSLHPVYLPFLVVGALFMLVPRSISMTVGFGMLLIGTAVGFLKYRDLQAHRGLAGS